MSVVSPLRPTPVEEVGELGPALAALADRGWAVLHQLRWPGRLPDPVDHVLVGPGGVVVVAERHPAARAGVLRPGRKGGDHDGAGAALAGEAIASLLHSELHGAVRSVLCCADAPRGADAGAVVPGGVHVLSPRDLLRWTAGLPAALDDDEAQRVAAHLRWQLGDPAERTRVTAERQLAEEALARAAAQADGVVAGPFVGPPVTRRALREAERRAQERLAQEQRAQEQRGRWSLSRRRARPDRAPAPAGGWPRQP